MSSVLDGMPGQHLGAVSQGWGRLADGFSLVATVAGPLFFPWLTPATSQAPLPLFPSPSSFQRHPRVIGPCEPPRAPATLCTFSRYYDFIKFIFSL